MYALLGKDFEVTSCLLGTQTTAQLELRGLVTAYAGRTQEWDESPYGGLIQALQLSPRVWGTPSHVEELCQEAADLCLPLLHRTQAEEGVGFLQDGHQFLTEDGS